MAQYHWTAEDYAVGDVPSDAWTAEANITSYDIQEDANGNKYLDISAPDDTRSFLSFDPPADAQEAETWARILTDSSADVFEFHRGTNLSTPSSADVTRTDYHPRSSSDRLSEFAGGSWSKIAEQAISVSENNICEMRGSISSSTLTGRWWADGTTEPSTWDLSGTTNVSGSGAHGFGHYIGSDVRIYEFSVGTGGDPAPTGSVATTVTGPSVTLDGSAVQGAVITIIDNDTGEHLGQDTTDSNGDWAIDVPSGSSVHCMAEYEDADGNLYRDYSKPFVAT